MIIDTRSSLSMFRLFFKKEVPTDSCATTMHWNRIPASTLIHPDQALAQTFISNSRRGDVGMVRMRNLIERFVNYSLGAAPVSASIADIHGNVEGLRQELNFIKDRGIKSVVCTGDLIDRDPNSIAVIRELQSAQSLFNLQVLIGNHDLFFLRAVNGSRRDMMTWLGNGGMSVLAEKEVGLEHWNKYVESKAAEVGLKPLQWIRKVLSEDYETQDRIMRVSAAVAAYSPP